MNAETERYQTLRAEIKSGLESSNTVAPAITEMHDSKLYKVGFYKTFKQFVKAEFDMTQQHANRLVDYQHCRIRLNVPTNITERALRYVAALDEEGQDQVWATITGMGFENVVPDMIKLAMKGYRKEHSVAKIKPEIDRVKVAVKAYAALTNGERAAFDSAVADVKAVVVVPVQDDALFG
jgi:hypothetical protein